MSAITELSGLSETEELESSPNSIHVSQDADDTRAVRRIQSIMHHLAPPTPSSTDKALKKRAAPIDAEALQTQNQRLDGFVSDLGDLKTELSTATTPQTFQFPNLAWEAVKAGIAKENLTNIKLNGHIKEAEDHQKNIDLLLDFSAELTAHKEDTEMSPKMQNLLSEIKGRGIDIWKSDDKVLSKEKLSELKSLSSAQVDRLRSNLQIIFTTKIQALIQSIGSIMETLKDIIRNNTKLINTANRLPGH